MDRKEKKILYEVAEDARASRNVLAKRVGVSREVLDYRLKKLEREGVITGYQARINLSNFVYGGYILLIQSLGLTKEHEEKVIKKIGGHRNTQYVGRLGGGYDFIIGFTVKDIGGLSNYVGFINTTFSHHKLKLTFLTMVEEIKDSFRSIFSEKDEKNDLMSMPKITTKVEVDSIDKAILKTLGEACLTASWKIAQECKISEIAIRKRMKKLIDKKVILGFRTMINVVKLGYEPNFVFIRANISGKEDEDRLTKFFQTHKRITYASKLIGEQDYALTVLAKSNVELNDFLISLRNDFKKVILGVENYPLFEMMHHTQLARGFLE